MASPKAIYVLIPQRVNGPFDGKNEKKGLVHDLEDLEMGDYPASPGWALHAITDALVRGRFEKGEGNVTTEAETAVMRPQAKECGRHQTLEEARTESSLEPLEGTWPS